MPGMKTCRRVFAATLTAAALTAFGGDDEWVFEGDITRDSAVTRYSTLDGGPFVSLSETGVAHEWSGDGPDYSFGTAADPLASGELSAPEGVAVRRLSIAPAAGATVALSGGPINVTSEGSLVNASAGTVQVDAPLVGTSGLSFSGTGEHGEQTLVPDVYPSQWEPKILFADTSLEGWEIVSGLSGGADIGNVGLLPYNVCPDENGGYYVQMKCDADGWVKGVKLHMFELDGNVMIQAMYARYVSNAMGIDVDMDSNYAGDLPVATSDAGSSYGVKNLVIRPTGSARTKTDFVLNSAMTPNGALTVGEGTVVKVGASADFGTGAVLPDAVVANGTLDVTVRDESQALAGRFTGANGTLAFSAESVVHRSQVCSVATGATMVPFADGVGMDEIVDFDDITVAGVAGTPCFLRKYDGYWTVQIQGMESSGAYVFCNMLTIFEAAPGQVVANSTHCYFLSGGKIGDDLEANHACWSAGGPAIEGDYPINSMRIVLTDALPSLDLEMENQMEVGTLRIGTNVLASAADAKSFPVGGTTVVRDGGVLQLTGAGAGANTSPFLVQAGGVLRPAVANAFSGMSTRVTVDGGILDFAYSASGTGVDGECDTYLNNLVVRSGARLTGHMPRVGYRDDYYPVSTWSFGGSEPSYWGCGCALVGASGYFTLAVDVQDVTDSPAVDLYQTGEIRDFVSSSATGSGQYGHVRKSGAGTWRMGVRCPRLFGDLSLDAGCLQLGQSDTFEYLGTHIQPAMTFNGGSLACEANTSNGIRNMGLSENSTIVLGDGAFLAFGDSSGQAWTAGKRLSIENFQPGSVRFGENANGLTQAQVRQIRVNGKRCMIDDQGFLCANLGFVLMIR